MVQHTLTPLRAGSSAKINPQEGIRCPKCGWRIHNVIDSRREHNYQKRRRECRKCIHRFNTYEFTSERTYMPREQYTIDSSIGDLSVTVKFTYVEGYPGNRMQPADPEEVEIDEVLVKERDPSGEIIAEHDIAGHISQDAIEALEENCLYHVKYVQGPPEEEQE